MPLVSHDAAHLQSGVARSISESASVCRVDAAARQADIDVDEYRPEAPSDGGVERRIGVNSDGDVRPIRQRSEAGNIK